MKKKIKKSKKKMSSSKNLSGAPKTSVPPTDADAPSAPQHAPEYLYRGGTCVVTDRCATRIALNYAIGLGGTTLCVITTRTNVYVSFDATAVGKAETWRELEQAVNLGPSGYVDGTLLCFAHFLSTRYSSLFRLKTRPIPAQWDAEPYRRFFEGLTPEAAARRRMVARGKRAALLSQEERSHIRARITNVIEIAEEREQAEALGAYEPENSDDDY